MAGLGEGAEGVAADADPLRRHAGSQVRLHGGRSARVGGHVDGAAGEGPSDAVADQRVGAAHVGGQELARWRRRVADDVPQRTEAIRVGSDVEIDQPGFAAHHAAHLRLPRDAAEDGRAGLRGAVVGDGDLDADARGDEGEVPLDAARDGRHFRQHAVGAGPHERSDSATVERRNLCEEHVRGAGNGVHAQDTNNRGEPAAKKLRKRRLGNAAARASLAAASGDVDMDVYQARDYSSV